MGYSTVPDHDDSSGDLWQMVEQVSYHHYGQAEAPVGIRHQFIEFKHRPRVEVRCRLVQQEKLRLLHQGAGERYLARFAAREPANWSIGEMTGSRELHHRQRAAPVGGREPAQQAGAAAASNQHRVEAGDRRARVHPLLLRDVADPAPKPAEVRAGGELAQDVDRTGARARKAVDDGKQRGLARSVRADDAAELTPADFE